METMNIPETVRLHKTLEKKCERSLDDGVFAEDKETTLNQLREVHFPDFQRTQTHRSVVGWGQQSKMDDWNFAVKVVGIKKVE